MNQISQFDHEIDVEEVKEVVSTPADARLGLAVVVAASAAFWLSIAVLFH